MTRARLGACLDGMRNPGHRMRDGSLGLLVTCLIDCDRGHVLVAQQALPAVSALGDAA